MKIKIKIPEILYFEVDEAGAERGVSANYELHKFIITKPIPEVKYRDLNNFLAEENDPCVAAMQCLYLCEKPYRREIVQLKESLNNKSYELWKTVRDCRSKKRSRCRQRKIQYAAALESKTRSIVLDLSAAEFAKLSSDASKHGMDFNDFVRSKITTHLSCKAINDYEEEIKNATRFCRQRTKNIAAILKNAQVQNTKIPDKEAIEICLMLKECTEKIETIIENIIEKE